MSNSENNRNRLTIGLLNPQGHVRWKNLQIASHPDTGGQIVYIIEIAKVLEKLGCKVDIFTRYFKDGEWPGYDREIENYNENLRIVRIKGGPENRFVRKEDLWPIINRFTVGIKEFYIKEGYMPDIFTSHYADAGLAGAILKKDMKIPFIHTGHSLGGKKMDNLHLSRSNFAALNDIYKFHLRIVAERIAFRNSSAIIASTEQEVEKQYGHKVYTGVVRDKKKFNIIPPGINPEQFFLYHRKEKKKKVYDKAVNKLRGELKRYISKERLELPCIFSAARFDAKKNTAGLLRAYGESEVLQENTNLLIIAGKVKDPLNPANRSKFKEYEKHIIEDIIKIIDDFALKGKVCVAPGVNYVTELPYIYRYAGRNSWIFINPALHEPFGLTVVEAMASGVPVVATKHGGPAEILQGEKYGILVEPTDWHSISGGLEKMLFLRFWKKYSQLGIERVQEKYTWRSAAKERLELVKRIIKEGFNDEKDFAIPDYFIDSEKNSDISILKEFKRRYYIG